MHALRWIFSRAPWWCSLLQPHRSISFADCQCVSKYFRRLVETCAIGIGGQLRQIWNICIDTSGRDWLPWLTLTLLRYRFPSRLLYNSFSHLILSAGDCLKSFKHFHNISLCLLNAKLRPSMCVDMDKLNGQRTNHLKLSHFHACIFREFVCIWQKAVEFDSRSIDNGTVFDVHASACLWKVYRRSDVVAKWWQMLVLFEPYLKSWCRHKNRESDYNPLFRVHFTL